MAIFDAIARFLVMLPLAAMPSSSVALVVVSSGRMSGAFAALGVVAGDLIFIAMALVGMSVLAEWLGALFSVVKYCGGVYLIWLGVSILKLKSSLEFKNSSVNKVSYFGYFLAELFLALGDVKAILFYASLFPSLIEMTQIGAGDVLAIAMITIVTVGGVKLSYAAFSARIVARLQHRVSSNLPGTLGGTLMIGCGSVLLTKA